jgi:hypothetical protein
MPFLLFILEYLIPTLSFHSALSGILAYIAFGFAVHENGGNSGKW